MPLSYTHSMVVLLVGFVALLLWLAGGLAPLQFGLRPFRAVSQQMVTRKGLLWTCLVGWSVLALVVSVFVWQSGQDPLAKATVVACAGVPPALLWGARSVLRSRRRRRYALPSRRR